MSCAIRASWSSPDPGGDTGTKPVISAMRLALTYQQVRSKGTDTGLYRKYLHHLVAEVIDDLHGEAARLRARKRTRLVAVERRPRVLVDFALQRRIERFMGIVRTHKVSVPDEETLFVVARVDDPYRNVVLAPRPDFARL